MGAATHAPHRPRAVPGPVRAPRRARRRRLDPPRQVRVRQPPQHPGRAATRARSSPPTATAPRCSACSPCADVDDLPDGEIDLVFVCTPAAANPDLLRACAKKGITAAFIASAGYGEAGERGPSRPRTTWWRWPTSWASCSPAPTARASCRRPSELCAQIVGAVPAGRATSASPASRATSSARSRTTPSSRGVGVSRAVSRRQRRRGHRARLPRVLRRRPRDRASAWPTSRASATAGPSSSGCGAWPSASRSSLVKGGATAGGPAGRGQPHRRAGQRRPRVRRRVPPGRRAPGPPRSRRPSRSPPPSPPSRCPRGNRVVVVTTVGGWGVVTADAIAGTDLELRAAARRPAGRHRRRAAAPLEPQQPRSTWPAARPATPCPRSSSWWPRTPRSTP